MRTYVSPIGYDTRRVTRPVVNTGLSSEDRVVLLRPSTESDTERATQAVADVEQLLQEIEPGSECDVQRVPTDSFAATVHACCDIMSDVPRNQELVVSLGGGARDILLPLTISVLTLSEAVNKTLFFSDLDNSVQEWQLPRLTAQIPTRAINTFEAIVGVEGWVTLSKLATETDQAKSTVIRHVNDLEDASLVKADASEKAKRVRISFSGELLWRATLA